MSLIIDLVFDEIEADNEERADRLRHDADAVAGHHELSGVLNRLRERLTKHIPERDA